MPGSTYSTNLKIELMTTGENSGTWGDITNTNLGTAFEQAVIGLGNPDYTSDANLTITITNSNASQAARCLVLNVTSAFGSLTQTRELIVPTIQKQYIVQNNTSGGQSITVKTSAGTGITVPNGRKAHLYVNGTSVIQMFDFVNILGGTIDNTTLGATTASSARVTTLNASGATTLDGTVALGNAAGDIITVPGTIGSNLIFTDNTYDIGASGATRPRNLFLAGAATVGGNLSVGGTLTLTGGVNLNGNVTVGDASTDTLTINSTITSNLIFTDNTYDIGASGATRPRNLFLAGNATIGGAQTLTGALTVDSTTDSSSTTTGSIQTDGGVGIAKALYVGTAANIAGTLSAGNTTLTGTSALTLNRSGAAAQVALQNNGTTTGILVAGTTNGLLFYDAAAGLSMGTWASAAGLAVAGLGSFSSNVAIGGTATAWTGAYALSVGTLTNFGQRVGGNADLAMSWNGKWSGGTSGAGYTYLATGDVASSYEQNGSHRFYTTPTTGTAGGAISFPVRLAISAAGYTYINYQGTALANLNILTNGVGGGIQLMRNDNTTAPTIGQSFGTYAWKGQDSANSNTAAEAMIEAIAAENHTGSTAATNMLFYVKNTGVGPGSAPSIAGAVNYLGQWTFGGATSSGDSNAKLTLYTSSSAIGLTIYEQSTGNNARLRLSQNAGAVVYDATYSSGTNSHVFQIGSGTVATIATTGLSVVGAGLFAAANGSGSLQIGTNAANQYQYLNIGGNSGGENAWQFGKADNSGSVAPTGSLYFYDIKNNINRMSLSTSGNLSLGTSAQEGRLTVAYGNESTGQVQLAQFRTEATGSTTYNAGVQIYGTASATAVNRSVAIILDADGANAAGGDYIVFQKNGNNGAAYLYNANNAPFYFGTNSAQTVKLDGANTLQIQGRSSTAYGTVANVQEWSGQYTNLADGASFSLFAINNQYDMLCYELNIFTSTGGFFAYKSAGIFGYNGFTNTVLGSACAITITRTGTLYNETMTLTNGQGSTYTELTISLRVWGYGARNNVGTGGSDLVTSSYLVRQT